MLQIQEIVYHVKYFIIVFTKTDMTRNHHQDRAGLDERVPRLAMQSPHCRAKAEWGPATWPCSARRASVTRFAAGIRDRGSNQCCRPLLLIPRDVLAVMAPISSGLTALLTVGLGLIRRGCIRKYSSFKQKM